MSTKKAFSRSDVVAINTRMSRNAVSGAFVVGKYPAANSASAVLSRSPASPVAAKVMREVGVSNAKMSEAYSFARNAVVKKK